MSAILKVGYSVENAIRETWKEICPIYKKKTRIIKEYETMVHQLDLNMTAEEVMKQFADRVKEEDVENFVTVFGAAKRLGGDSIAIIRHAADAIGEKMEVEREIQVMLTSKKLEFKIMCVIPFVIILYMRSAFPEFMAVLYGNLGRHFVYDNLPDGISDSLSAGQKNDTDRGVRGWYENRKKRISKGSTGDRSVYDSGGSLICD